MKRLVSNGYFLFVLLNLSLLIFCDESTLYKWGWRRVCFYYNYLFIQCAPGEGLHMCMVQMWWPKDNSKSVLSFCRVGSGDELRSSGLAASKHPSSLSLVCWYIYSFIKIQFTCYSSLLFRVCSLGFEYITPLILNHIINT